jgi:hypothetical protein
MSVHICSVIWDMKLDLSEKMIALALADMSSDDGVCWPSIRTLTHRSGLKERRVQQILKKLESAGTIFREERIKANRQTSSITVFSDEIIKAASDRKSGNRGALGCTLPGALECTPRIISKEPSCLKKSEGSPDSSGDVDVPATWIPDDRTKEAKLRSIRPPKRFPSEREFNDFLDSESFENLDFRRSTEDLYETMCLSKWHEFKRRRWSPIRDWKAYLRGLDRKIGESLRH